MGPQAPSNLIWACGAIAGAAALIAMLPVWAAGGRCTTALELFLAAAWGGAVGAAMVKLISHPTWLPAGGLALMAAAIVGRGPAGLWVVCAAAAITPAACMANLLAQREKGKRLRQHWNASLLSTYSAE